MESAYHGDRKSCSTRLEISTPGDKISFRGRKNFVSHSKIAILDDDLPESKVFWQYASLDYANWWRGQPMESAYHGDRKSCSTQLEISTPVCRLYSSPGARTRVADAIAYGHPFAQKGITFRSIIRITYMTPIRNRHSEAPVAHLLPQTI
ncbi:hypothetical protein Taro_031175 [Colocasia esculenta]|uniref:Uncharacterized protein n=1 Tax=Colocasia esculenta TaxID=4460 RepID=A0A843W033_COLES|nr:hypothetical protein [Colocasia esculenta]